MLFVHLALLDGKPNPSLFGIDIKHFGRHDISDFKLAQGRL